MVSLFSKIFASKNSSNSNVDPLVEDKNLNQLVFKFGAPSYKFKPKDLELKTKSGFISSENYQHYKHNPSGNKLTVEFIPIAECRYGKVIGKDAILKLLHEIDNIRSVSQSENIATFYGSCIRDAHILICMESMDISLSDFNKLLHHDKRNFPEYLIGYIIVVVLDALREIKKHGLSERTVSTNNILINSSGQVKLSDFGLYDLNKTAGILRHLYEFQEKGHDNVPHKDELFTIWTIGITLLELVYGKIPFVLDQKVDIFSKRNIATDFTHYYSEQLKNFVESCLENIEKRPTYVNLIQTPFYKNYSNKRPKLTFDMALFMRKYLNYSRDVVFEKPVPVINNNISRQWNLKNPTKYANCNIEYRNPSSFKFWWSEERRLKREWNGRWPLDRTTVPNKMTLDKEIPVHKPNFDVTSRLSATWLGNTTLFVHLDGASFIVEPYWCYDMVNGTYNTTPSSVKRYRDVPCRIDEVPTPDFCVYSVFSDHNAYEHYYKCNPNFKVFTSVFKRIYNNYPFVIEMNWGDKYELKIRGETYEIWCVPNQSTMGLYFYAGFVVVGPTKRFLTTSWSGLCESEYEKIGKKFGPIDLCAISIGGWGDRNIRGNMTMNANDAIKAHKLFLSRQSIGICWGTFKCPYEDFLAPRFELQRICKDQKITNFITLNHGDTYTEEEDSSLQVKL